MKDLGFDVQIPTHPAQLRPADSVFCVAVDAGVISGSVCKTAQTAGDSDRGVRSLGHGSTAFRASANNRVCAQARKR